MSATDQSNILNRLELSHNLRGSLQRAAAYAYQQSHREVTVEHLLLSLTEDRDAAVILEASNVEVAKLVTEVADYLGRLEDRVEGDGARQPTLGRDLIHIFQSAAAAAQKSQRRAVGSALVLAAIVGEGRSPSAHMLKNHGMTFEQAIAALRQANAAQAARPVPQPAEEPSHGTPTPSDAQPADEPGPPPPSAAATPLPNGAATAPPPEVAPVRNVQAARDVLASARERVAAVGGTADSQAGAETPQSADKPSGRAPDAGPARKADAPARAEEAGAKPARPAPPENDNQSDVAAKQGASAPPPTAPAPPQTPTATAKPVAAQPAALDRKDKQREKADAAVARQQQAPPVQPSEPGPAARPTRPVAPPASPHQPSSGGADRGPANRPPPAPSPGAGAPPPQQRRPRWPDWAKHENGGSEPSHASGQPAPPDRAAALRQPGGAGPLPSHPGELRAEERRPGPAGPPPDSTWQPRHPAAHGDTASPARPQPVPRSHPQHAPAQRPHPAAPPAMPDLPPFDPRTLVEQIPTRMRVGKPLTVNVRVPRRQLEAWSGGGPDPATHSQHVITKAMVMRLKAAPVDFSVEHASPETQWSEGYGGPLSDDIVSWRWVVAPRRSGRHILQLSGSTRIVGRDGLAAERPLPPQRISVRVSPDYGRLFRRVAMWLIIAGLAGTLGYFADGLFDMGRSVLAQLGR